MKLLLRFFLLVIAVPGVNAVAQNTSIAWWNPAKSEVPVMEGQGWPKEVEKPFDRLPSRAEKTVRPDVWNLSRNTAGLMIRFRSDADQISVRYIVSGSHAMPHMPATGASGVDLYAINADGDWMWCAAKYSFKDTILYNFRNLEPNDQYHKKGREYRLYLPLYNDVQWMEIGVPKEAFLHALPARMEKPIVVYGTSIAQGGCASRPGMAWTAILGRKLDRPLINLGFSGNGKLEKEVLTLVGEIDAKVYVLDCLPNLDASDNTKAEEVTNKVVTAVKQLRQKRPSIPILLTEHAGYMDEDINPGSRRSYTNLNQAQRKAFEDLKSEGMNNLFLLSKEEIGMSMDGTVDSNHPTDLGMFEHANGYEKILRRILNEPTGTISTTQPCIQSRDANVYDWNSRHQEILSMNKVSPPKIVFIGNSITHFWGGEPKTSVTNGPLSWERYLKPLGVRNFGYGWDRIENVLWRVYHDELAGYEASQIVILIGTNNMGINSNEQIVEGLQFLIRSIQQRQPKSEILVLGIYPRRAEETRIVALNQGIVSMTGLMNVRYLDAGSVLLGNDKKINESLFTDGLHPNEAGYKKLAERMVPFLKSAR